MPSTPSPQPFLIASYPRSGNHLVRAIVEYATRSATHGCPTVRGDIAIHQREPNRAAGLIRIDTEHIYGRKAHSLFDAMTWHERDRSLTQKVVLVSRNPVDAISSQLLRGLARRWFLSERHLHQRVQDQVRFYLETVYLFRACDTARRHRIRLEDLLSDAGHEHANHLLGFIGCQSLLGAEEFRTLKTLARDSQKSLKPVSAVLRARVRAKVAGMISPEVIEDLLGA